MIRLDLFVRNCLSCEADFAFGYIAIVGAIIAVVSREAISIVVGVAGGNKVGFNQYLYFIFFYFFGLWENEVLFL